MRIIYLHQYFNTPDMPGSTRSYEMGRRMATAGHEVHIVTSRCDDQALVKNGWYETMEAGMHVHWLVNPYSNRMSYKKRVQAFFRYAWKSMIKATNLGGDVVFATSTPLTVAIPAVYASHRKRIPMIFEVRDLWPEGPIAVGALKNLVSIALARWLERRVYFDATHVIALSPVMKEGILATGYPAERVTVIPNCSDVEMFRVSPDVGKAFLERYPYFSDGPLVTYAGALGLINGVGYMVDIASKMLDLDPSVRFLIIGDGRENEKIRKQAEEMGVLERNLWMMPLIPKRDMPAVLSASTVALSLVINMPHIQNNSANKMFDAFAAGRPLAINHGGWMADILRKSGAGIVIPPSNANEATRQLADFLHDEPRLARAREATTKLADEQFHRDKLARELIAIIESVTTNSQCKKR